MVIAASLTDAQRRFALFSIAIGGFGIGASEFVSMGLLPQIANSLLPDLMAHDPAQGIARAGWLISAYALGVVVGAPVLATLSVRMNRARLVVVFAACLFVGSVLSAVMPSFELMLVARFLSGVPHGAYFGVASLVAASLMGPGSQGKGVAMALAGLSISNLIGVPLLTAFGQNLGWRVSYLLIAAVFAITVLCLVASLVLPQRRVLRESPELHVRSVRTAREELSAFGRPALWVIIAISSMTAAGLFAYYSYIADIATRSAGLPASMVPLALASTGLGMTIGNVLGGILTDKSLVRTLVWATAVYALTLVGLYLAAGGPVGFMVMLCLASMASSTIVPALQTWLIQSAGDSQVLGASLNHAAFNIANTIGAVAGGAAIAHGLGYRSPILVALGLVLVGLVLTLLALAGRRLRHSMLAAQSREHRARVRAGTQDS